MGWVSPLEEEDAPLIHQISHYLMICLQIEEKILPSTVIQQELKEKIKQIEVSENRKVRLKEKFTLKDEILFTLVPRAFSRLIQLYAYIDIKKGWLVLGSANPKRTGQFISMLKKSLGSEIQGFNVKALSYVMTHWLKHQDYPDVFSVEKACVLQDPNHQLRIIRCQQQDLFATSIQALIKEGCDVKQLALNWQDRVEFTLSDRLALHAVKFEDGLFEETKKTYSDNEESFDVNFLIMSEMLCFLFDDLLAAVMPTKTQKNVV
jgi:recombination associated protein RdgC